MDGAGEVSVGVGAGWGAAGVGAVGAAVGVRRGFELLDRWVCVRGIPGDTPDDVIGKAGFVTVLCAEAPVVSDARWPLSCVRP